MKKRTVMTACLLGAALCMPQMVSAEDAKTALNVIISQYGAKTQEWWTQFETDFEAENPDVDLNIEIVSWNDLHTKVSNMVSTQQQPDILNIDTFSEYVADDLLMPAEDYVSDELKAKFFDSFWNANAIDDTVYALPILASARAMWYNPAILEEAGVEVPTTWDELRDACAKIKEVCGDEVYPWGIDMTTDEGQAAFTYYAWNNGGGFTDEDGNIVLNSEENAEAVNFAVGLVNDGYTNEDPANQTRYDLQDLFGAGKLAMMIGPNNLPTYLEQKGYTDIDAEFAAIPTNVEESTAMGVCDRLLAFKNDKAEDQDLRTAAIGKFFDFFYDDARYADYMVFEGFLPTTQTAATLLGEQDEVFKQWIDILQNCNFYPTALDEWADIRQGVVTAEQEALLGTDAQEALDEIQDDIVG